MPHLSPHPSTPAGVHRRRRGAIQMAFAALAFAAVVGCTTGGVEHRRPPAELIVTSTDLGPTIRSLSGYLSDESISQALAESPRDVNEVARGLRAANLPAGRVCRIAVEYVRRVPAARADEAQRVLGPDVRTACTTRSDAAQPAAAPAATGPSAMAPMAPRQPANVAPASMAEPRHSAVSPGARNDRPADRRQRGSRSTPAGDAVSGGQANGSGNTSGFAEGSEGRDGSGDEPPPAGSVRRTGKSSFAFADPKPAKTPSADASAPMAVPKASSPDDATTGTTPMPGAATAASGAASAAPAVADAVSQPLMVGGSLQASDFRWGVPPFMSVGRESKIAVRVRQSALTPQAAAGAASAPATAAAATDLVAKLESTGLDIRPDPQSPRAVEDGDVVWRWVASPVLPGSQSMVLNISTAGGAPLMTPIVKPVDIAAGEPPSEFGSLLEIIAANWAMLLVAALLLFFLVIWVTARRRRAAAAVPYDPPPQ